MDDTPADADCADYIFHAHAAPQSEIPSTEAEARDVDWMRRDGRAPTDDAPKGARTEALAQLNLKSLRKELELTDQIHLRTSLGVADDAPKGARSQVR
ncbi:hypothetical protein C8F04DRAFT_1269875 [Mycena alexandri]|uniref:Uncharacterized protein n=1 Tax=Mycena alexandri TaxID=1745969 RepID=A0AAD6SC68_9AGAR|nr:hypothetical protein C8F04DRAFT_1269875 [Mycena alexandri]